jgi:hypothetical protein
MQLTVKFLALGVLAADYSVVSRSANMWCTVYEVELREGNPIQCDVISSAAKTCEYPVQPCTMVERVLGWRTYKYSPPAGGRRQEVS